MKRPGLTTARLALTGSLIGMGVLIEVLAILLQPSIELEFMLLGVILIILGSIVGVIARLKGARVTPTLILPAMISAILSAKAEPTMVPPLETRDGRFAATKAEGMPLIDLRLGTANKSETRVPYHKSPIGLNAPAFVCRCGHHHRFVCLDCGMNTYKALKKKGMRWVEWQPEMPSLRAPLTTNHRELRH